MRLSHVDAVGSRGQVPVDRAGILTEFVFAALRVLDAGTSHAGTFVAPGVKSEPLEDGPPHAPERVVLEQVAKAASLAVRRHGHPPDRGAAFPSFRGRAARLCRGTRRLLCPRSSKRSGAAGPRAQPPPDPGPAHSCGRG